MRFDTVTRAQRLATDFDELTNSYWREPSLAEKLDAADTAFRHWDTLTFAPAPTGVERDRRDGATAAPPETDRRGPALTRPAGMEPSTLAPVSKSVGGQVTSSTVPSEAGGLPNPSVERWMWTA